MKRILSLILAAALLVTALSGCADKKKTAGEAVLSGTEVTAKAGEQVVIPVVLSGMDSLKDSCNGRLAGFQFDVSAPGLTILGAVTELSSETGSEIAANWTVDDSAQSDGSYLVMVVDMNLVGIEAAGDAEIARIQLKVPDDASGEYTVNYTITDICDTDANSDVTDKITASPSKVIVK